MALGDKTATLTSRSVPKGGGTTLTINSLFDGVLLLAINLNDIEKELGGFLMGLFLVRCGGLHFQLKNCLLVS